MILLPIFTWNANNLNVIQWWQFTDVQIQSNLPFLSAALVKRVALLCHSGGADVGDLDQLQIVIQAACILVQYSFAHFNKEKKKNNFGILGVAFHWKFLHKGFWHPPYP